MKKKLTKNPVCWNCLNELFERGDYRFANDGNILCLGCYQEWLNQTISQTILSCRACQRRFICSRLCERCQSQDAHHERKIPQGACQQCLEKGLKLTKTWNDKYYCKDCLTWQKEAVGMAMFVVVS